jgi:hypothetical protein
MACYGLLLPVIVCYGLLQPVIVCHTLLLPVRLPPHSIGK